MFRKIIEWNKNARDVALVQSVMPTMVAIIFALGKNDFNLILAILALLGVMGTHLATNLLDDYFDYKNDIAGSRDKVQRKGYRAMMIKYPYLTNGSQTLHSTRKAIIFYALSAILCGLAIFLFRTLENGFLGSYGSWWIAAIALTTAFLAYFYTAPPLQIAYYGLGELETGIIFGPLLMIGVYYASCAFIDWGIVFLSIPIGILVINILFTHSFIDMEGDKECHKMTFARLLGTPKRCLITSFLLNLLPFIIIIFAVLFSFLSPLYLCTFLFSLPRALWLCYSLLSFYRGDIRVPDFPPLWLGPMVKDWQSVKETGTDWFLMRWMAARNTLSSFCLSIIVVKIILLIF